MTLLKPTLSLQSSHSLLFGWSSSNPPLISLLSFTGNRKVSPQSCGRGSFVSNHYRQWWMFTWLVCIGCWVENRMFDNLFHLIPRQTYHVAWEVVLSNTIDRVFTLFFFFFLPEIAGSLPNWPLFKNQLRLKYVQLTVIQWRLFNRKLTQ